MCGCASLSRLNTGGRVSNSTLFNQTVCNASFVMPQKRTSTFHNGAPPLHHQKELKVISLQNNEIQVGLYFAKRISNRCFNIDASPISNLKTFALF